MKKTVFILLMIMGLALLGCQQAPAPPPAPPTTAAPAQPVAPQPVAPNAMMPNATTPAMPMAHGIGGTPDAASAKTALRTWLNCFVTGDGGIFYDMLPSTSRVRFDQWFAQRSSQPDWKADPDSAKVPTARHFMILAFEEAKKQGSMMAPVSDADFAKIANTCQMSGNIATFINKQGQKMVFTLEPDGWKMDAAFANTMVTEMTNAASK